MIIYAGASPRPWGKIIRFDKTVEDNYEQNALLNFRRNLPKSASKGKDKVIPAANALLDVIEARADEYSLSHKTQLGLTTGAAGDFVGFFGYWTNHLFNTDPPPVLIWDNVFSNVYHARSLLKEGKLGEAGRSIVNARYALLQASGTYFRWKEGIEGAGVKMQFAIGAVAVTLILAATAATVATAAAGAAAASGSAVATVESVSALVTQADFALVRVVAAGTGEQAAGSIFLYGEALEAASDGVAELLEMVQ